VGLYADRVHGRIALVGETERDVREVMIEGRSSLLAISPTA
jgi:phage terminase large subunit-like protein